MTLLTFLLLFLNLLGAQADAGWRKAYLQAALGLGAMVALSSEALSLFSALNRAGVYAAWAGAFLSLALLGWHKGWTAHGWAVLRGYRPRLDQRERYVLAGLGFISLVLLGITLIATPNNSDSMLYHLARVAHWVQNGSLRHYPTGYEHQLANPIWAEAAILQLRLLGGGGSLANLVQWWAMLGSLIGVSALAGELGASRKGQWATAVFAATVPMGLLQATSTQNDYAAGLWLVCLAYFVILASRRPLSRSETISLGLALGLGMLTKGTLYPYAVPFGAWFLVSRLARLPIRRALGSAAIIAAAAVVLNLGYWARNLQTYGAPLGPRDWVARHTSVDFSPGALLAAPVENLLLNFATPSEAVNTRIVQAVNPLLRGLWPEARPLSLTWAWNFEDLAGHPLGVLLAAFTLGLLAWRARAVMDRRAWAYSASVLASFLVLSLVVAFDSYGARYQLPFWLVFAPVFGLAAGWIEVRRPRLAAVVLAGLLLTSLPYLFLNRTRPLVALRPKPEPLALPCLPVLGCTRTGSILLEPPEAMLFANWTDIRPSYTALASAVETSGCREVGVLLDSHEWEYPLWWLLDAPESGVRLETLHTPEHLTRYADPSFQPCAVICSLCGETAPLPGLELALSSEYGRLYLSPAYSIP